MKRFGNLYARIYDIENLRTAFYKASAGRKSKHEVILFEKDLEVNLLKLQNELKEHTYRTSEYQMFMVRDPKEREVFKLPFRDRIIHHAIMNILEPIWGKQFISHSYSAIKGRGIHGCLKHLKRGLRNVSDTRYCLKMDLKKFYPSINHDILKQIIRKKIKDHETLALLDEIIDSAPGVPIGNYLSQFFANLYLTYFDHWMKEIMKVKYYYRYADDIVILHSSKEYLWKLFQEMNDYLSSKLKMTIKGNYQVFPVDKRGIDFVGYVFYHTHIRIRKRIKRNFCRTIAKLKKRNKPITNVEYTQKIATWLGWAKFCNSINLLKKVITNDEVFRTWYSSRYGKHLRRETNIYNGCA